MSNKSDLELWLESPQAKTAVRAAHKINDAAREARTIAAAIVTEAILTSEEQKAYEDMLTLMDRLARKENN